MLTTARVVPTTAFMGALKATKKLSIGSEMVSLVMSMRIVRAVSPGAKTKVPSTDEPKSVLLALEAVLL